MQTKPWNGHQYITRRFWTGHRWKLSGWNAIFPKWKLPMFFFSYIDQIHSKHNRGLLVILLQVIVRRSFAFPPTSRQTFVSNTPKDDGLNTFSGAVHWPPIFTKLFFNKLLFYHSGGRIKKIFYDFSPPSQFCIIPFHLRVAKISKCFMARVWCKRDQMRTQS